MISVAVGTGAWCFGLFYLLLRCLEGGLGWKGNGKGREGKLLHFADMLHLHCL